MAPSSTLIQREGAELHRLLTAEELADTLGLSAWSIYDAHRTRGLPGIRFGRRVRFDPLAVRRWLDGGGEAQIGEDAEAS